MWLQAMESSPYLKPYIRYIFYEQTTEISVDFQQILAAHGFPLHSSY